MSKRSKRQAFYHRQRVARRWRQWDAWEWRPDWPVTESPSAARTLEIDWFAFCDPDPGTEWVKALRGDGSAVDEPSFQLLKGELGSYGEWQSAAEAAMQEAIATGEGWVRETVEFDRGDGQGFTDKPLEPGEHVVAVRVQTWIPRAKRETQYDGAPTSPDSTPTGPIGPTQPTENAPRAGGATEQPYE